MEGGGGLGQLSRLRPVAVVAGLWTLVGVMMAVQDHHRLALAGRNVAWTQALAS